MKSNKKNYHLKFKDKVVDAAANSEFIFNKTPILVPVLQSSVDKSKSMPKRQRPKAMTDYDHFDEPTKKRKGEQEHKTGLLESIVYTPLEGDLYSYFKSTKVSCKSVEAIPKPKYEVGSYCLTAVCDRGIGGKYLVTSFSRNLKGYIDYKQLNSTHNPESISQYAGPGEFLLTQVVKGQNAKHIQLSLATLNSQLNEKQLRVGQVVSGEIKSKQEMGCIVKVYKGATFKYFMPKATVEENLYEGLLEGKQMMFWVSAVESDKKFVTLSLKDQQFNLRGVEEEDMQKYDLEAYLQPGTRVNTMILKKLRNGLLVKFLKIFYGYIFIDHLSKPIEDYKVGDKFECRIVHFSLSPPTMFLSELHTDLAPYRPARNLYSAVSLPEDMELQEGVYISKSQRLMIHPLQMHTQIGNIEKLYVKENNYFEKYQICSSRKLGLRVGEVSRVIPFQNFKVFGKGTGKFRVMCLDVWNKVIKASYDKLVLEEKDKQLNHVDKIDLTKQYVGFVSTVSSNGVIVEFQNSIKGLLNSHEIKVNGGQLSNFTQGQGVLVYIRAAKEHGLLELALSLTKKQKRKRKQSGTIQTDGEKMATICSVNSKSIQPVYIRLKKKLIPLSVFKHIVTPQELHTILPLEEHFKVGDRVKVYIKDSEYFLYPPEQLTNPKNRICRVVGLKPPFARLQYEKDQFASCHISEVTDLILPNPINSELALGEYRVGRVLDEEGHWFSLRESIVKHGVPNDIKECIKRYGEVEKNGDYRSRMLVLPNGGGLKPGMLFFGYVKTVGDKGCFVTLSRNYDVRVELGELSDDKVPDANKQFYDHKLVFGRLMAEKTKANEPNLKLFDASLRVSVIKYGYQLNFDTMKVGLTVNGRVTGYTKGNALVSLQGCKYRGIISPHNHGTQASTDPLEKIFPMGTKLRCKIIAFETDPKLLIKLSTLEKHFNMYPDESALHNEDAERTESLLESVKELNHKYEQHLTTMAEEPEFEQEVDEEQEYKRIRELLQLKGMDEEDEEEENVEAEQEEQEEAGEAMDVEEGEDDQDEQGNSEVEEQEQHPEPQSRQAQCQRLQSYLSTLQPLPHSSSHYQSLLLSSPTVQSHLLYISSLLQQRKPEQIRLQFAKSINSLKTIKEKQNMWIAWINMETILGDFENTVKKAIEGGATEKIYFRIVEILMEQGKWDVAVEFARAMVKKFSGNLQVWEYFLKVVILFRKEKTLPRTLEPKEILKRAQQVMDSKQMTVLETHYGKLQYQLGQPQNARTIFESQLSKHPKRTDIWSVYIDMETKYGDKSKVPGIFERALTLNLKVKKTKFILKKYLKFAEDHLTAKDVQTVLDRAAKYAKENLQADASESEEEDEQEVV